jgi:predicted SnoaL-like aldol condensation-catalyzing enzyme
MQRINLRPLALALALADGVLTVVGFTAVRASAAPTDNTELANRLVAQFVAAENAMNVDAFDDIFTVNYIQHNPGVAPGLAGVKAAFADEFKELKAQNIVAHSTAESVVVDGDMVVLRQHTTLQKGNKHYEATGFDEWRIVDGRFGEHWDGDGEPHPVPSATP